MWKSMGGAGRVAAGSGDSAAEHRGDGHAVKKPIINLKF